MSQAPTLPLVLAEDSWPEAGDLIVALESHLDTLSEPLADSARLLNLASLITPYLHHLLSQRYTELLHLLYRIDVPETRFRQVLAANQDLEQIAAHTAVLVIERLEKKRHFRRTYGKS